MRRRRLWAALMGCAVLSGLSVGADRTAQGQSAASLTLRPLTVHPGDDLDVIGKAFTPHTTVTVRLDGKAVAAASTSKGGWFATTVTVPTSEPVGTHTVSARGSGESATGSMFVGSEWRQFGFGSGNDNFNPAERTINSSNAGSLKQVYDTDAYPDDTFYYSPAVGDGLVFAGDAYDLQSGNGSPGLNAFDESTGALVWSQRVGTDIVEPPTVAGQYVYDMSGSELDAWSAQTGEISWSTDVPGVTKSAPKLVDGVFYEASSGGTVAIDATTHQRLWLANVPGQLTPAVDNDTVFVLGQNGNNGEVSAVDATDGTVLWQTPVAVPGGAALSAQSGLVIVTAQSDAVMALNESDGSVAWTFQTANPVGQTAPAIANGTLFELAGSNNGSVLYALNLTTGTQEWATNVSISPNSNNLVVANGVVYLAASESLLTFDSSTGDPLGSVSDLSDPQTPAVVNGNVYVGTNHGVYDFAPSS